MAIRAPRTSKEIMDFQLRGKLPVDVESPETPLRALITKIPVSYWRQFGAVKLSPKLGFNSSMQFHSVCQLVTWLGHNKRIRKGSRPVYQSHCIRAVRHVSLGTLLEHCTSKPSEEQLIMIERRLPPKLRR